MLRLLAQIFKSFTRRERLILSGAGLIFIVAFGFTSARAFYQNTVSEPAPGGEYTEGIVGQPIAINPVITTSNEADRALINVLFSDPVTLSESYATSSDGKTWTLTLKKDLEWSDGEPLTADDLIFTLDTIQNPDANSSLASSWQGVVTERLSEHEIRFTLKTPYVYFLDNLRGLKIIPRHIFEDIPAANFRLSGYNLEPVGSGPYQFTGYEKQKNGFITAYHLTRNPHFAGARPLIDRFNFSFYKNFNDALTAFNSRSIDGLGGLDPASLKDLQVGYTLYELNIPRYYAIFLNSSVNQTLKDVNVRQALDRATDKEKIIKTVFLSHALAANGPLLPYLAGFDPGIYGADHFSPEEAAAILEKGGWKLTDGIRTKTIGKTQTKLELEIIVPQIQFLIDAANLIKSDWEKIGVRLSLIVLPPGDVASQAISSRNYQLLLFGNILRVNPDIFSFWHSSQRFQPGLNLALYENKTVDTLLESIRKDPNEASREKNLSKIQSLIHNDYPAIFLFSPNYLYAAPKELGGLDQKFIATPEDRFANVTKWYLKTTRVFK